MVNFAGNEYLAYKVISVVGINESLTALLNSASKNHPLNTYPSSSPDGKVATTLMFTSMEAIGV